MSVLLVERLIEDLVILVVDDNPHMRKLTRLMLTAIGAKSIYEASDGVAALDLIRTVDPDIMLLDWDMPLLSGPQVIKVVRSPGSFPKPNLPIIMLTASGLRSRVGAAMQLGVHEFLLKPTSPRALRDRLLSILLHPRPMVRIGKFYVPKPRIAGAAKPEPLLLTKQMAAAG